MDKPSDLLGEHGPFAQAIEGFQVRHSQQALSDTVLDCMQSGGVLAAEAGTGIGKTFAYLVPAIISGKKVIISTGTRHLQDQLFKSDIPRVLKALDRPVKTALLKGRANYLCWHRLQIAPHLGFVGRETQHELQQVVQWSGVTDSGDIAELDSVAEDSPVWPMVTSTADNCLGGDCEHWNDCFLVKARKQALDADVLVINHHLLLADMTLKQDGFAELLPGADAFVVDEAHQLHDVASRFFGRSVGSRQLLGLAHDAIAEQVNDAPDMAQIREYADTLEAGVRNFRLALGDTGLRQAWNTIRYKPAIANSLSELKHALMQLANVLAIAAERSRGLDQCHQRCIGMQQALAAFDADRPAPDDEPEAVLWYETWTRSFMLHATPVDVSAMFREHADDFSAAWLFTSATLQVNNDFSHFASGLGIGIEHDKYRSGVWDSPFNYQRQSLIYLPPDMPEPSDSSFVGKLIERVRPVLAASGGRAFLLFTSYRAMNEAAAILEDTIDYPVLLQGQLPKHRLLQRFREAGNAILLGTSSFWEGVDVRGEALSCVVIDKLPFASPGDPVMQARIDAIRKHGGQPFMEYQLPRAVLTLKQGVGRLIRDVTDHGVVVLADPRLKNKAYGKIFLKSLPPMPVTSKLEDVQAFYRPRELAVEA
jgi:ATP-dependent DNA helicase DinG